MAAPAACGDLNRMNAMLVVRASDRLEQTSAKHWLRPLWLLAATAGIGLVMASGVARAEDPEADDDSTFEEKIIKGIMTGLGGTNMENRGITYRERSPLVVPPKLNLPPPETAAAAPAPNWPTDPEELERKRMKELAKKKPVDGSRPLMPSELAAAKTKPTNSSEPMTPGTQQNNPMLSPSQLGFNGSLWNVFGGNKSETATFTGEPQRETLTQPPTGYQTPSPNFAYGTGPKESLGNKRMDVMTGKETSN
jgi:hypothetical protein